MVISPSFRLRLGPDVRQTGRTGTCVVRSRAFAAAPPEGVIGSPQRDEGAERYPRQSVASGAFGKEGRLAKLVQLRACGMMVVIMQRHGLRPQTASS